MYAIACIALQVCDIVLDLLFGERDRDSLFSFQGYLCGHLFVAGQFCIGSAMYSSSGLATMRVNADHLRRCFGLGHQHDCRGSQTLALQFTEDHVNKCNSKY